MKRKENSSYASDLKWRVLILFKVRIAFIVIVSYYENYQGLSKKSILLRHVTNMRNKTEDVCKKMF